VGVAMAGLPCLECCAGLADCLQPVAAAALAFVVAAVGWAVVSPATRQLVAGTFVGAATLSEDVATFVGKAEGKVHDTGARNLAGQPPVDACCWTCKAALTAAVVAGSVVAAVATAVAAAA